MSASVNAASVALLDGDSVMLIRRARAPYAGLWTLPGGRLEAGEGAAAAAAREIYEELGLTVTALTPVMQMQPAPQYRLAVFATRSFTGVVSASDEIMGWRWVPLSELHALPTTPQLEAAVGAAAHLLRQA